MKWFKNSFKLSGYVLLCFAGNTYAASEHYRYRLEQGAEKEVCQHMTQVFNSRFKTPWDKGTLDSAPVPKIQGVPYDQVFERMPGVEYNKRFVFDMLLSKYPTSPEFEAVKWLETRVTWDNSEYPALIVQLDIDNDGRLDWIVKSPFMHRMTTWEGWQQGFGGRDDLELYAQEDFDSSVLVRSSKVANHGEKPVNPRRNIDAQVTDGLDTSQLRPFVFKDKTYLSAYQVFWPNLELSKKAGQSVQAKPDKLYPDREYMNILAALPGGVKKYEYSPLVTSNTETVCRIRMIMQK